MSLLQLAAYGAQHHYLSSMSFGPTRCGFKETLVAMDFFQRLGRDHLVLDRILDFCNFEGGKFTIFEI